MMSKKQKKRFVQLNYIEHFFILAYTISGCFSYFASLGMRITSSAIRLKICPTTAEIKKYKSIIKKKKHNKIVLLAKSKLDRMEVLISKLI